MRRRKHVRSRDCKGGTEGGRGYVSHGGTEETEAAGQACLAQRGIFRQQLVLSLYCLLFCVARLRREQGKQSRLLHSRFHRERSGVLLGSSYPLCAGNWKAVPLFILCSGRSRAILNGTRMYIKSRYFTYFPSVKAGLSRRLRPPLCLCARRNPPTSFPHNQTLTFRIK